MWGGALQISSHDEQLRLPPHLASAGANYDVKIGCPRLPYPYPLSSTVVALLLRDSVTGLGLQIWVVASDGLDDNLPTATFKSALVRNNTAMSSAVNVLRSSPSAAQDGDHWCTQLPRKKAS